jgi:chromosome segregation ATPase
MLTCVQKEELDRIMDLDSEEAQKNPEKNPLLRMKAGLEASLASTSDAMDKRTSDRLEEAAKKQEVDAEMRNAVLDEKVKGISDVVQSVTGDLAELQSKSEKYEERISGLDRKMRAIPNPQAALATLSAKTAALQAVDGKILGKVDSAVHEVEYIYKYICICIYLYKYVCL